MHTHTHYLAFLTIRVTLTCTHPFFVPFCFPLFVTFILQSYLSANFLFLSLHFQTYPFRPFKHISSHTHMLHTYTFPHTFTSTAFPLASSAALSPLSKPSFWSSLRPSPALLPPVLPAPPPSIRLSHLFRDKLSVVLDIEYASPPHQTFPSTINRLTIEDIHRQIDS